jgi:hypothetical protein
MITVTSKDALRAEVIEPGWKPGEVMGYTPDTAGDGSMLHKWQIEVEFKGLKYPLQDYMVSEKAVSMGKAFFIACGFPEAEWEKLVRGEATSSQIDPNDCVGKKLQVMVINDKFNNRITNKAGDFLKPKS